MTPTQYTLFNFGVHDTRDISLTGLFSEILDSQGWFHRDCIHWLDSDGLLHVIHLAKRGQKSRLVFQITSQDEFVCLVSAMVHDSLPF